MEFKEYVNRWKKLSSGLKPQLVDGMHQDISQFEEYIREQLYSGVDGNENALTPGYMEDPYFDGFKNPKKAAEWYKNWKARIQPPRPSYLGFSARNSNTPNLIIRGDFYSSITAIPISDGVRIVSYGVAFGADIERKYGSQIFKISEKAGSHYMEYRLLPKIERFIKECGL
jgi:hypothetical protein